MNGSTAPEHSLIFKPVDIISKALNKIPIIFGNIEWWFPELILCSLNKALENVGNFGIDDYKDMVIMVSLVKAVVYLIWINVSVADRTSRLRLI